jgi:hypothetical protein
MSSGIAKFKTLLFLEIQLLLGCYVEWSVPQQQNSADPPVLSAAGDDADADESDEEGGSSGVASPTRARISAGCRAATATQPLAAGTLSSGSTSGGAGPDSCGSATSHAAAARPQTLPLLPLPPLAYST